MWLYQANISACIKWRYKSCWWFIWKHKQQSNPNTTPMATM
jgi:hypothetical protein